MLDEVYAEVEVLEIETEHKKKLKKAVDDIVNQRVITKILDILPKEHHPDFLKRLHAAPYDIGHLKYLVDHASPDIVQELINFGHELKKEIALEIKKHRKKTYVH